MSTQAEPLKRFPQPLDRIAITLMLVLALLIGGVLWSGDRTAPRVRNFTWQDKQIGAEHTAFILNFSRPMNEASVEANLRITPPLPGKISWAGRRMAYTLVGPAPYGTAYEVRLQSAKDRFVNVESDRATIQPFVGRFRTRDRAFAYMGVEGEEEGRLILYNLTQQQKQVLTPKELVVMDFKPYPRGDRILFSAIARSSRQSQGLLDQQLYTVTTGLNPQSPEQTISNIGNTVDLPEVSAAPAAQVNLVLDNKDYQNLKFDLGADGQVLVVQRVKRHRAGEAFAPGDSQPWLIKLDAAGQPREPPVPLQNQSGGDFLITPDSTSVAIAQGEGLAIIPLQPQAQPLDFLPKFGMVLGFARDGSQAAMVQFNKDYTRSLFLVTNQGVQKELLRTKGSIVNAQFGPLEQTLYCLLTRLVPGDTYQEQPLLAMIDLKTGVATPLLALPMQRDIQMSLAPDGLALLFDQTVVKEPSQQPGVRTTEGKAISTSRLWLLPIVATNAAQAKVQPESLPLAGARPRWLP